VSTNGLYARITPEELDRVLKDPELERDLETKLFDDGDYERWFIDHAWDGLSYLLTMNQAPIDVVCGGTPISDFEWTNDGPARYLTADQVKEMAAYFRATPWQDLARHYDPAAMEAAGCCHSLPDDEDEAGDNLHWLGLVLEGLAEFFAQAASVGDAVITILG
jgi:uncharacterized protein DUF1877